MDIAELEGRLVSAQARCRKTLEQQRVRYDAATRDESEAAQAELLAAERALSLAKGEETALPCDWKPLWETGAPLPMVLASEGKTYLLYLVAEPDPDWDGSYTTSIDPASSTVRPIALVEFVGCHALKFGSPNDEVISGHPLYGKGLQLYGAHLIANSRWLAELDTINSVHPRYNPSRGQDTKHYLLLFHDSLFECLARDYTIELIRDSFSNVLEHARARLVGHGRPHAQKP